MLELTIRDHANRIPLEVECLAPDRLATLAMADIEKLLVQHGNRQSPLAEHFAIKGDASDGQVRLNGDCSIVKLVGHQMASGKIVIDGPIGMHVGAEMTGGEIEVRGDAGDWVGAEMAGGRIHVHGNAGHCVGGVYRGGSVGMRGGVILIDGDLGNELGGSMRRGLIAVGGGCGDFAGVAMNAGSIFVFGKPGIRAGAGMNRGTIALFGLGDQPFEPLPSFRYDCDYAPTFMQLYLTQLRGWSFPFDGSVGTTGHVARYSGDLLDVGKGEILVWRHSPT